VEILVKDKDGKKRARPFDLEGGAGSGENGGEGEA
jgi:hypothetical protein